MVAGAVGPDRTGATAVSAAGGALFYGGWLLAAVALLAIRGMLGPTCWRSPATLTGSGYGRWSAASRPSYSTETRHRCPSATGWPRTPRPVCVVATAEREA